ncbi:hypothetical protein QNO07_02375 [Streptomyces sp. 549]|uniref:hypothetical protein n=1 Tax=Streptomyces sp. 549 TaxID=3049076 RepID=UPI0024C2F0CE|nr:hypothetical protein [Streptomyces sp. 549]MDK1472281.1 hypothetical protein [Streptomyces sp. 549]
MAGIRASTWVVAVVVAVAVCSGATAAWWLYRDDPAPYALQDTPEVQVTVRPVESRYPDAKQVAQETELVIKVYLQRLRTGDAADLSRIGAPWYTGREQAARELISQYGPHAVEPVEAVVSDPVVPRLASADLRFADGSRQRIDLTKDKDVWWLALGEGDPVKP